jgi:hypothetical protein
VNKNIMQVKIRGNLFGDSERDYEYFSLVTELCFLFLNEDQF